MEPELREYGPDEAPIEGDRLGWHIRLRRTMVGKFVNGSEMNFELWQLWYADQPRSNYWDKKTIQQLRDERLAPPVEL